MGVNSLPKTVTRQTNDCDLNRGPSVPESSTLTSHSRNTLVQVIKGHFLKYNILKPHSYTVQNLIKTLTTTWQLHEFWKFSELWENERHLSYFYTGTYIHTEKMYTYIIRQSSHRELYLKIIHWRRQQSSEHQLMHAHFWPTLGCWLTAIIPE